MVSGNHWSCVHFNWETGDGLYTDSIGREVPLDFEDTFVNFFQVICKVYKNNTLLQKALKCGYFCLKKILIKETTWTSVGLL